MKKTLFALMLIATVSTPVMTLAGTSSGGEFDFKSVDSSALSSGSVKGKSSDTAAQQGAQSLGNTVGKTK